MGSRVVLPAKSVGESRDYQIDFLSQISEEEQIESATCSVSVYCGDDPAPEDMIERDPRISGRTIVSQRLSEGLRGVIYMVTVTAVTDLMQIVTIKAYLAVLDPDADVPSNECCTRIGNASSINGKDFTITFVDNPITELRHGLPLFVIFDNDCTQDEPTLNPDGLGAAAIGLTENTSVKQYEILTDDVLQLVYDEDETAWILMGKIATQWIAFKQDDSSATVTATELFDMPGLPAAYILAARAGVKTASSSGKPTFTATCDGDALFSTALTIDVNEKGSYSASVPVVIDSAQRNQPAGWELVGNCTVAGTGTEGWWMGFKVRFLE